MNEELAETSISTGGQDLLVWPVGELVTNCWWLQSSANLL